MRRPDPVDQAACFRGRIEHVCFGWCERLEGHHRVGGLERRHEPTENLVEPIDRLLRRHAGQQAPLMRRAEHHHPAAEIPAQPGEVLEVANGSPTDFRIGMRDVKAFDLGEQPVKPHALEAGPLDRATNVGPLRGAHLRGEPGERERRDFEPLIAAGRCEIAGLLQRPVLKCFVADRVAHCLLRHQGASGAGGTLA